MNTKTYITEIIIAVLLLVTLVLFGSLKLSMSHSMGMLGTVGFLALLLVFIGFILRERALDERDEYHRSIAGRIGFIAGVLVLALGIIIQNIEDGIDMWLLYALGAMILGKLFTHVYLKMRK